MKTRHRNVSSDIERDSTLRLSKTAIATIALMVIVGACIFAFPARTPLPLCSSHQAHQGSDQPGVTDGKGCYKANPLTAQDVILLLMRLVSPIGGGASLGGVL
jgi:hypothetical protein